MGKLQRSTYLILFFVLGFAGLYFAKDFLIPVALAAVFSMLFIKLCNWFERKKLKRGIASLICIIIFISAIGLVVFLLSWQLNGMIENMDQMKHRLTTILEGVQH